MTTEPFWFFSLLKIHLATQLVWLSPNLRRGRRVDDGNGTWSPPAVSPTNKTQRQSTSCSSSPSSDLNTSHSPCFSPTPTHTSRFRPAPRNTPFPQNGLSFGWLVSAGNLCFMVAIPLPASDWKFNRQALEMLLLSLSLSLSPHTHQSGSIKPTGLYVSVNERSSV